MAGQYGSVRVTTQNITVVKLLDDDNLILVEGSVPGSKNGIVTITDSVKYNVPKDAPFPAGLRSSENSNDAKEELVQTSEKSSNKIPDNEGAQVEN
jgi:large subunit ribosomal protein L3